LKQIINNQKPLFLQEFHIHPVIGFVAGFNTASQEYTIKVTDLTGQIAIYCIESTLTHNI